MRIKRPRFNLHVTQTESAFAQGTSSRWTNADLDPVPNHLQNWGVLSFVAYWLSDAFNVSTWQFASSILAVGLTYVDALVIVAVSFTIIAVVIAANGAVGAIYHAPFPVIARASWGFWGSYVPILSRLILALFWFAIHNVNGGNAVCIMLEAVWPGQFGGVRNRIPPAQGISTKGMIGYLVYWIVQFPLLCMRPDRVRWVFVVKSVLVPVAWVAILVWALVVQHGVGDDDGALFRDRAEVHGSRYSWLFLASMTSVLGNYATTSVNQSDFSRYSRVSPKWQLLYIPMLPVFFTFISFIGIAATSAGSARYHPASVPWEPTDLISHWSSRACRFFGAASFALASLGVNISANSISAANDLAALLPGFFTIRRGQILCALLSWGLVPWKILESAETFLNFMSAYAIFLGPVAAIMCWDFWLVKARRYDVRALYSSQDPIYRYSCSGLWGVNWRAVTAFLVGVAPNLPGLIHSLNASVEVGQGVHPYQFGWLLGFFAASVVYVGLSWAFPAREALVEKAVLPEEVWRARECDLDPVQKPVDGGGVKDKA